METVYHFVIIFLEFDFVIVPTLEYDRFNLYKLRFFKL
ncbi:hypothetical protein LEP1GSC116_0270 [Leptospira interrogans serovar Icterohaemorrhagiae str. Verdun HP]|uniref:Uncharacterized protein n=5 Tax=Leptospira interrogans TaxID=173 RepID=M7A3K5_LEPIR|nr:hypothetical protein LEP1GSC150_0478 [Leptospira interrogans serovar Copenhageni str. LT2050]EMM81145.1 hypothetical protein LEP1GSC037_1078 [Leptospira interrogans str. 2006001854]EMM95905.1 hypothetical protein LEP1GSC158_0563 [Leptospira interrogans serovar Zanoni str. LT2156]EMO05797.1 hypothetical protein LEP1GSC116_0270 [Leptospira interrogans serovar Icterohaemorrhagiae str. Verdun HP]EMO94168.1 hypothetical protein LEP1GSC109_2108 [Leptospira interrogans str. UI 13372]EMP05324.1 hyp